MLQAAGRFEHLLGVSRDADLRPDPGYAALAVEEHGRALDAHVLAPVHALLDPDAEGRRVGARESVLERLEVLRLAGAAARVVLWIEEQDDLPPLQGREIDGAAARHREREGWRWVAGVEGHVAFLSTDCGCLQRLACGCRKTRSPESADGI